MIKFFKNEDILVTKFVVSKQQVVDNILLDLILGTDGNDVFPIIIPVGVCNNITSGSCEPNFNNNAYLANSGFVNNELPEFEIGKYFNSSSVFYPSGSVGWTSENNPMNVNGTYKRQVYNTVKNMYYNNYNNCYNIFGFNTFNINNDDLNLTNEFSLYSLRVDQAGDTIRPKSVIISNQSGDILSDIYDDGNNNLFLTGSHFTNYYEFSSNTKIGRAHV